MKKIIITLFTIFALFGCAEDEKNQPIPLPYPQDNNTGGDNNTNNIDKYYKVLLSCISNISTSDNVSTWGFEPYNPTNYLHVYIADKLGRPSINSKKIVYVSGDWGYTSLNFFYNFNIYDNNTADPSYLHQMTFDSPDKTSLSSIEHNIIDYYTKFIKTEPYKNLYEHIIYVKE